MWRISSMIAGSSIFWSCHSANAPALHLSHRPITHAVVRMTDHVKLEPSARIQVRIDGQLIVDTTRGIVVHEGGLPVRYYVPLDEVRAEVADGQGSARCPWKGLWKHLDVTAGGRRIRNAGWTYYQPTPNCESIRDFIAFYPDKVDAIDVE